MEIRKEFSFMGTHTVRNCSSSRCKYSIHSHLYIVEVFISSPGEVEIDDSILDNGQMVYDFGLTKTSFKEFVSSFNDTYAIWNKEPESFKDGVKKVTSRWVELPFSPSAESLSLMFLKVFNKILSNTITQNGEKNIFVSRVKVHETRTGYAEATEKDIWTKEYKGIDVNDMNYSSSILFSKEFKDVVLNNKGQFINEKPTIQIEI